MKTKIFFASTIIAFIFINSCIKDNFDFDDISSDYNYSGSWALPAVYGEIHLIDAIGIFDDEDAIAINEEGYLSIFYRTTVKSDDVHEIIFLPDQQISGEIETPDFDFSDFLNPGDTVHYSYQMEMEFDVFNPDAELERILLKEGLLSLNSASTFHHTTRLYIEFPSITKDGETFKQTYTFAFSGDNVTANINLEGYDIDMTQTPKGFNEIPVNIGVTIYYTGAPDNSGELTFSAEMTDMQYDLVEGFFGINTLIFESDTLEITLFKSSEFTIEAYRFEDPKFKINYLNSYGIPSSFYFSDLTINSAIDELDYDIIHYGGGIPMDSLNPYMVSHATNIGDAMEDSLFVTRENSNLPDIIAKRPQWIKFVAHANTNPTGADRSNFITSESSLEAKILMELPMWGYIYNFHRHDTLDLDIKDLIGDEDNPAKRALIRLEMLNGLPIEVIPQVYFVDNNYNILDSIFYEPQQKLIAAAVVDAQGKVIEKGKKITKIEFDIDRLDKVNNTKHLIIGGQANTANADSQELVKIYDDYRLSFDIGFEVDFDFDVNLDDDDD